MNRIIVRCFLTEKRLFRKISFIIVLLMIPVLVAGLKNRADEESGLVRIGLYTPDEEGSFSDEIIDRFLEDESVFLYSEYESEEEGIAALEECVIDALWILPEDLDALLLELADKNRIRPVIRVIEREDDVALIFTREILCSKVFPRFAYDAYTDYVSDHIGADAPDDETLRMVYDSICRKGNLFAPGVLGKDVSEALEEETYFTAPMRGLLAIWMVLAGFAALMYYKNDEEKGVHDMVPVSRRLYGAFALQAVVLTDCGIIYLIACGILGILTDPVREITYLILFAGCISVFCNILGLLINDLRGIGMLVPFAILLMIVLCPVFFDLRSAGAVRGILPPFYYLKALYDPGYLMNMVIYLAAGSFACVMLNLAKNR